MVNDSQTVLNRICRTCAELYDGSNLIPIFEGITITTYLEVEYEISNELTLLNLQIEKGDDLPQQICIDCIQNLKNICVFRENCKKSQSELREFFKCMNSKRNHETSIDNQEKNIEEICNVNINENEEITQVEYLMDEVEYICFNPEDKVSETQTSADFIENGSVISTLNNFDATIIQTEHNYNTNKDVIAKEECYNTNMSQLEDHNYMNSADQLEMNINWSMEDDFYITGTEEKMPNTEENIEISTKVDIDNLFISIKDGTKMNTIKATENKETNANDYMSGLQLLYHQKNNSIQNLDKSKVQLLFTNSNKYVFTSRLKSDTRMFNSLKEDNKISLQLSLDSSSNFCCFYCNDTFKSYESIEDHIVNTHDENIPYLCKICKKQFKTVYKYQRHLDIHHSIQKIKCEYCSKYFPSNNRLKRHISLMHHGSNYECSMCFKKFYYLHTFKKHLLSHDTTRKFKCNYCDKAFKTKTNLRFHEEVHINAENPYKCEKCDRKFLHKYSYEVHMRLHDESNARHICEFCGRVFPAQFVLNAHRTQHLSSIQCDKCGKKYRSSWSHKYHKCIKTPDDGIELENSRKLKKFKECQLQYKEKQRLLKYNYKCNLCTQTFQTPPALKKHMSLHDKSRGYQCDICHLSYLKSSHLQVHINCMHSKQIVYDCPHCDKKFYTLSTRNNHVKAHERTYKAYKCAECGKSWATRKSLKLHKIEAHSDVQFVCTICKQTFKTPVKLRSHFFKHSHKESEREEQLILEDFIKNQS